jgi:hypothetical protein
MWYTVLITLILDVGGLLLIYVLLRDRVRRAASSDAQIAEIRDEVSRLLVELNRTTDRNIALIEDRIASLNELLSSADKKIGLLRRETEKHDVGTQIYSRLAEGRSRVAGAPAAGPQPRQEREEVPQPRQEREEVPQPRQERDGGAGGVAAGAAARMTPRVAAGVAAGSAPQLSVELSDGPESRVERGGRESRQGRDQMPQPRQERDGAAGRPPDLQQRVVMLHNAGFAASLIASRVGVPLGEVELIIALQERKGRA